MDQKLSPIEFYWESEGFSTQGTPPIDNSSSLEIGGEEKKMNE